MVNSIQLLGGHSTNCVCLSVDELFSLVTNCLRLLLRKGQNSPMTKGVKGPRAYHEIHTMILQFPFINIEKDCSLYFPIFIFTVKMMQQGRPIFLLSKYAIIIRLLYTDQTVYVANQPWLCNHLNTELKFAMVPPTMFNRQLYACYVNEQKGSLHHAQSILVNSHVSQLNSYNFQIWSLMITFINNTFILACGFYKHVPNFQLRHSKFNFHLDCTF